MELVRLMLVVDGPILFQSSTTGEAKMSFSFPQTVIVDCNMLCILLLQRRFQTREQEGGGDWCNRAFALGNIGPRIRRVFLYPDVWQAKGMQKAGHS